MSEPSAQAIELANKHMGALPTYHDDARYNKQRDMFAQIIQHTLDNLYCPDFETAVRMVAMHIHARGKFYIEIAVDEKTKEVASTFEPTLPKPLKQIAQIVRSRLEKLASDLTFTDGEILREEAGCIEKVILEFAPAEGGAAKDFLTWWKTVWNTVEFRHIDSNTAEKIWEAAVKESRVLRKLPSVAPCINWKPAVKNSLMGYCDIHGGLHSQIFDIRECNCNDEKRGRCPIHGDHDP